MELYILQYRFFLNYEYRTIDMKPISNLVMYPLIISHLY